MMPYRMYKMVIIAWQISSGSWFGDVSHVRKSKVIGIPNFNKISQYLAEILLLPFSEDKQPPYWNSFSGFHFDIFIVIAVLAVVILPSVHSSHACFVTKSNNALRFLILHERAITVVFWHQQWLVGDAPSVWNLHSKWPIPFGKKNTDFDRFPLITSQP